MASPASADWLFLGSAANYYIAGRYGVFAQLSSVSANLLHHTVEMFMKAALNQTMSLEELKGLNHHLPKSVGGLPQGLPVRHARAAVHAGD